MEKLIKVAKNTYYINSSTNIGLYTKEDKAYLIDSGSYNLSLGEFILQILKENHLKLEMIINTHAHADHTGLNEFLQKKTHCKIYAPSMEANTVSHPVLQPSSLFGSYPPKRLKKKFLMSSPSIVNAQKTDIPKELKLFPLYGHSYDMIGIQTDDNVYFIADSIFPKEVLALYHMGTIYNLEKFLLTLDYLDTLKADLFIPSHSSPVKNIKELTGLNRKEIIDIKEKILMFLNKPISLNVLVKRIFDYYSIEINYVQYHLIESTTKAFISYLIDKKEIDTQFMDNYLLYKRRI